MPTKKGLQLLLLVSLLFFAGDFLAYGQTAPKKKPIPDAVIHPACDRTEAYWEDIKGKRVALLVNQTSVFSNKVHLVDSLKNAGIKITCILAPEHGFRGDADAGQSVTNTIDKKTGIAVISLYGKHEKPSSDDLKNCDVVIFDLQDVGARFYTYISTLFYVMQACAEQKKPMLLFDRPNPNGYYIDGPVLDLKFKSFVGMFQLPVVYGMTIGELSGMINEEGWLGTGLQCDLTVIKCAGYDHTKHYSLPVNPSPNLPNEKAIELYPSLCFFEGTEISVGRGTDKQFQVLGNPNLPAKDCPFTFKVVAKPGAKTPPFLGKTCKGFDLSTANAAFPESYGKINLEYLIRLYALFPDKKSFFHNDGFFDKLAGSDQLRQQIIAGLKAEEIRESWKSDLDAFKKKRKKYLLYKDF